MKTKLLKKVRRRFKIIHCPKGIVRWNEVCEWNYYKLIDNDDSFNNTTAQVKSDTDPYSCEASCYFNTDKEAIDHLKGRIIRVLKAEGYGKYRSKITKIIAAQKQVWP
jgi:hypothetical protein